MKLNKTKYTTKQLLAWLWKHHRGCRLQALLNAVFGLALVGLSLLAVDASRKAMDIAAHNLEGSILTMAFILAAIYIAELLVHIASTWVGAVLGVRTQNSMQQSFFSRLLKGRWSGVERFHSGDVLNRLFGDVDDIVKLMTEVLPSTLTVVAQFIASFVYLYAIDSELAIIIIATSPVFILFSRIYFRKMRRIVRKIKDSNSAIQSVIQESVQHKMVVKVMGRSEHMVSSLEQRQGLLRRQIKARARFSIFSRSMINIGFAGAYLVAFVWGLLQLDRGIITVGVLTAFLQLVYRIQRPLLDISRLLPVFVNSMTSCERLMELEELPLEDEVHPTMLSGSVGIRFSDVSFQYAKEGRMVIDHFTHDFRPGTFTAILGATGAGKTTLIRLMLALMEPTAGSVSLYTGDDSTPRPASPSMRTNFSYIPQGNTLFSGTIRENLLFGNPSATTAQMKEALHLAMADFVLERPEGLETRCGEGGGGLSEGQAQRIAIARALLHPCKVLLLDEATSALDTDTERQLLINLKSHFSDSTIIFVTHRLAVVDFTSDVLNMAK